MRKISEEKAASLQRDGVKIYTDGSRYLHFNKKKEDNQESLPEKKQDASSAYSKIDQLLTDHAKTQAVVAEYGLVMARCVEEIAKPKAKKKWGCVVHRNAAGQINNVDIEEK